MLDLSATERQMALNEVRVLATLDHPNIVTYYDSFERDGVLMIEMEYADGGNLAESLAKKTVRMEEKDIVNIFSQIVSAIRHMHDNNVLHRDLKTANIFLTKENMVKVGDFGISKVGSDMRIFNSFDCCYNVICLILSDVVHTQRRGPHGARHPVLHQPRDVRGQGVRREVRHLGPRLHPLRDGGSAENIRGIKPARPRKQNYEGTVCPHQGELHSPVQTTCQVRF